MIGDFERHLDQIPPARRPAHRRLPRRHDRQLPAGQPPPRAARDLPPARPRGPPADGHRPGQGPGVSWRPPTTTRRASPPSSTATCCACSTASSTPTSSPTTSTTWRCSTPSTSGSRCACARAASTRRSCATSTCPCTSTPARRCARRSAPSSRAERLEGDLLAAGLELVRWLTDPDELFALTLSSRRHRRGRRARRIGFRAMQIEGSAALVVGGASGLGEATVRAPARARRDRHDRRRQRREGRGAERRARARVRLLRRARGGAGSGGRGARPPSADGGLRIAICCAGTGWAQKIAGSKGPHPLMPFETIVRST